MRRHHAATLVFLATAVVTACTASPAATPVEAPTTSAMQTPTLPPTASPTSTETATATPSDDTALTECTSDPMPDLDNGWAFLDGGDGTFALAYPEDWDDLGGEVEFTTSSLLNEETFAELGVSDAATITADFVRSPEGVPNLSVFSFGEVESSAVEIQELEAERYADTEGVERVLDTSLEACLGGTLAHGIALEFASTDGNTYYQQNLVAVRDGQLYVVQWLDNLEPDTDLLAEILTTWGWRLPTDGDSGGGGIADANMASSVDESLDMPDPSTFVTSFPADAPTIYVVYRPDDGAEGTVNLTWRLDGEVISEATLDVSASTSWAYGGITPPTGGFEPGEYTVELELNGDVETLTFTVTDS